MKQGKCKKKSFPTLDIAIIRSDEINESNRLNGSETRLRAYFCEICETYHLSSQDKSKYFHLKGMRDEKRINRFVHKEAQYWEDKFDIN